MTQTATEYQRRGHVKHHRVSTRHVAHHTLIDAKAEIKRLKAKNHQLTTAYHESLLEHVLDLEIAIGRKKEETRTQELQRMKDSGAYTPELLNEIRKVTVTVLAQRSQPPEPSSDQKNPER